MKLGNFSVKEKVLELLPKDSKLISATGIYKLYFQNDPKNRIYIGSATQTNSHKYKKFRVGFYIRLYHHISTLKANIHHSPKLQNYINKYGFKNMVFEIVELCDKTISKEREEFYIKQYNCVKLGFNCSHDGHVGGGIISPETRKIISMKVSAKLKGRVPKNWESIKGITAKPVEEYLNNRLVKEYKSLIEMCELNNLSYKFFSQVLSGKAKLPKKYVMQNITWKYK